MGEMTVIYTESNARHETTGLTLVEQTANKLFLQDEDTESDVTEIQDGKVESVTGCKKIGIIKYDEDEKDDLDKERISNDSGGKCLYLSDVSKAEQSGNEVNVMFDDGTEIVLTGEFDRAYTY